MTTGQPTSVRGWAFPLNSRKAHYFDDTRISICGKWMLFHGYDGALDDANDVSPDNCMECRRKVEKLRERDARKGIVDGGHLGE